MGVKLGSGSRKRAALTLAGFGALITLSGCSGQGARFGLPEAASEQAPHIGNLWIGAWWASMVVGVLVWGLIGWSVLRYRRRKGDDTAPRQTKYHLPLELLYTLVPFLIIGVLFFYTVKAQDAVLAQDGEPDLEVNVIGQKWSWTFNYLEEDNPAIGANAYEVGTLEQIPDLYLPVGKTVRFNLESADVIHSFWIPTFYFKQDVIPGHPNSFDVTPNKIGVYDGKCAELCGTYHALMLFKVHVVSEEEYNQYINGLVEEGNEGIREVPSTTEDTVAAAREDETHAEENGGDQ